MTSSSPGAAGANQALAATGLAVASAGAAATTAPLGRGQPEPPAGHTAARAWLQAPASPLAAGGPFRRAAPPCTAFPQRRMPLSRTLLQHPSVAAAGPVAHQPKEKHGVPRARLGSNGPTHEVLLASPLPVRLGHSCPPDPLGGPPDTCLQPDDVAATVDGGLVAGVGVPVQQPKWSSPVRSGLGAALDVPREGRDCALDGRLGFPGALLAASIQLARSCALSGAAA
eukprot:CAMPEP_0168408136 /NCGR_PEP_ID=MMETSP0228-20121227/26517_1 /TAXON_ID=133427 /ORGANISM="Protoceratium reticulatum, Strain CCCM 535 (=CCMP 1889)" /LENGTH=226 /DNA_ID=CAMNT_0008421817 /DNA_START=328 /DNA_END=1004 /DNA_ORIENTATION=+